MLVSFFRHHCNIVTLVKLNFNLFQSDPMAVLFAKGRDGKLEELGRTEVILNNLNPTWINKVTIAYQFETVQPLV